jgi:predicted amidophosphoribosyltransferase
MFFYSCPTCGASAYSSANPSIVGACPRCSKPLTVVAEEFAAPPVATMPEPDRPISSP